MPALERGLKYVWDPPRVARGGPSEPLGSSVLLSFAVALSVASSDLRLSGVSAFVWGLF